MIDLKTGYDWCLESNMRILDLFNSEEEWYYTTPVTKGHFLDWLGEKKVKPNSTPRKTEMYLEYRMYGIVPYNISGIQAGIQFGHGVVEYQQNTRGMGKIEDIYNKWATKDKTFIICNGGTTNEDPQDKWYGSMQQRRDALSENDIIFAEFREPDLNNALSAVVFLVDERVFLKDLYEDFIPEKLPYLGKGKKHAQNVINELDKRNQENYKKWVEKIGGPKNDFLRTFANKHVLRLANN
jgi:hypothetical protein